MRDIKFRVWDNVDYMSTPFTLEDLQLRKVQFTSDCKVMQFTGLKDGDLKEIYEHDIVRVFYRNEEMIGLVTWTDQGAGWYIKVEPNIHLEINNLAMYGDENGVVLTSVYVKGNIYENPSLLTKEGELGR